MTAPLSAATSSSRSLLQTAIQPYGITAVQASLYASAQRSTTSSVDATKKFPICIIGEHVVWLDNCILQSAGAGRRTFRI